MASPLVRLSWCRHLSLGFSRRCRRRRRQRRALFVQCNGTDGRQVLGMRDGTQGSGGLGQPQLCHCSTDRIKVRVMVRWLAGDPGV